MLIHRLLMLLLITNDASSVIHLTGAGGTMPVNVYVAWKAAYRALRSPFVDVRLIYHARSSGFGKREIAAGSVFLRRDGISAYRRLLQQESRLTDVSSPGRVCIVLFFHSHDIVSFIIAIRAVLCFYVRIFLCCFLQKSAENGETTAKFGDCCTFLRQSHFSATVWTGFYRAFLTPFGVLHNPGSAALKGPPLKTPKAWKGKEMRKRRLSCRFNRLGSLGRRKLRQRGPKTVLVQFQLKRTQ